MIANGHMGQLLSRRLPLLRVDLAAAAAPPSRGRIAALEDALGTDLADVVWRQTSGLERDAAKAEVRRRLLPMVPRSLVIAEVRYDVRGEDGVVVGGRASVRLRNGGPERFWFGWINPKLERITPTFLEEIWEDVRLNVCASVLIAVDSIFVAVCSVYGAQGVINATTCRGMMWSTYYLDGHGRLRIGDEERGSSPNDPATMPLPSALRREDLIRVLAYPLYSLLLASGRECDQVGPDQAHEDGDMFAAHQRFLAVGGDRAAFVADALTGRHQFSAAILAAFDCADQRIRVAIRQNF